jgi:hypothetical protein
MMLKAHPVIICIDRSGFSLYQDTLPDVARFHFTQDIVMHSDVLNKEQLSGLISTFIQLNKIVGSSTIIVLSDDIIYVKDFPIQQKPPSQGQAPNQKQEPIDDKIPQEEVQKFLEIVPFEEVLAKVIKTVNVNRIVAVNSDLVTTVAEAFTSKGSSLEAIIPAFMYGQNFSAGLNRNNPKVVFEGGEIIKSGNLLTNQEKINPAQTFMGDLKLTEAHEEKKTKGLHMREYILIGVFVLLLVVLGIVAYFSFAPTPTVKKYTVTPARKKVTKQIPSPTPAPVDIDSINITITSSRGDQKAADLQSALLDMGIKNVEKNVSSTSSPAKTSVTFSRNIPSKIRSTIISEIEEIFPEVSIIEGEASGSAVAIIVGKT